MLCACMIPKAGQWVCQAKVARTCQAGIAMSCSSMHSGKCGGAGCHSYVCLLTGPECMDDMRLQPCASAVCILLLPTPFCVRSSTAYGPAAHVPAATLATGCLCLVPVNTPATKLTPTMAAASALDTGMRAYL